MKVYTERTVPEHVAKKLHAVVCDLCGKESPHGDWASKTYDVAETTISMEVGENYGDSGSIKETSYDICPECFRNKLMIWLEAQGAERTVQDRDW